LGRAYSANNEYDQEKDAKTVSALDLKPNFQDEITLGFEKAFSQDLNFGTKFTYRKLKSTLDDLCDARPFIKYLLTIRLIQRTGAVLVAVTSIQVKTILSWWI